MNKYKIISKHINKSKCCWRSLNVTKLSIDVRDEIERKPDRSFVMTYYTIIISDTVQGSLLYSIMSLLIFFSVIL